MRIRIPLPVVLICAGALFCGISSAADEFNAPKYEKKKTFPETMAAIYDPYDKWRQSLSAADQARFRKSSSSESIGDYRAAVSRDFPLEWYMLEYAENSKTNIPRFSTWFYGDDKANVWVEAIHGSIARLDKDANLGKTSTSQLAKALSGIEEERTLVQLYLYSNACRYLYTLETEGKLSFVRRIALRFKTDLSLDARLRQEMDDRAILDKLDSMLEAIKTDQQKLLENMQARKTEIIELDPVLQEAGALQRDLLALHIRSKGVDQIVFTTRTPVKGYYHWYESFGYSCDKPDVWNFQNGGRMVILDLRTGQVRDIFRDERGGVRDPAISYDGKKILFSYRPALTKYYHLYEINADGSGLRQLTSEAYDDIEPVWLPDGDIMFCSSRARRWVPCLNAPVANLYKCDGNGGSIEAISANVETENTPVVMPDGKILYMRWEYVERDRGFPHGLWTINPDGTGQMTFWGNMNEGDVFIDARPIPDTDEVIYVAHPHGSADHTGSVQILSPNDGPDEHGSRRPITPYMQLSRQGYRDPYPIAKGIYLVAHCDRLEVYDDNGQHGDLYELTEKTTEMDDGKKREVWLHEPRALVAHPREPIIEDRQDKTKNTAKLILADVTLGRNMEGVKAGEIKKLLVLEVLPKPVHHEGHTETISWNGSFFIERVLGTVPVEPDGSACFEVPAMRCLFFVALDENGNGIKRMQSFISMRPGENAGCVGCHESRTQVSPRSSSLQALSKPAAPITPLKNVPSIYHYPRDIQPILDKHCVQCHDNDTRKGNVVLNGDLDAWFNQSYVMLNSRRQYAAGYGGVNNKGNAAARTQGAGISPLMKKIDPVLSGGKTHHGVNLSAQEIDKIRYWIESWAQYSGTYASLNNDSGWRMEWVPKTITGKRCIECHTDDFRRGKHQWPTEADISESMGLRVNLTCPEKSLMLLAPLAESAGGLGICRQRKAMTYQDITGPKKLNNWNRGDAPAANVFANKDDPDYQQILDAIESAAQKELKGRLELAGFIPNEHYVREMKKHGLLPPDFSPAGKDIEFYFEVDDAYYRMFQPKPLETNKTTDRKDSPLS